jgi:hypothetical protein
MERFRQTLRQEMMMTRCRCVDEINRDAYYYIESTSNAKRFLLQLKINYRKER